MCGAGVTAHVPRGMARGVPDGGLALIRTRQVLCLAVTTHARTCLPINHCMIDLRRNDLTVAGFELRRNYGVVWQVGGRTS